MVSASKSGRQQRQRELRLSGRETCDRFPREGGNLHSHSRFDMPQPTLIHRLAGALVLAIAAAASVGCSPAARLHGKWEIDTPKLQASLNGDKNNPLAGMASGIMSMFKVSLEFKADGTCSAAASMLGQTKSNAGTWRFVKSDGDSIVIAAKMDDRTAEQEVRVRFIDDDHVEMAPPVSGTEANRSLPFVRVKPT